MPTARSDYTAEAIRAQTFIRHVEIHDSLGSTNDRAAQLARDAKIETPALVLARLQTAGRGRGQNKWWSADGALTFSIALIPSTFGITAAKWPQLSLATAVAVCDALEDELDPLSDSSSSVAAGSSDSPRLAIKWPNDVMLDGRKVAGILIESPAGDESAQDRLIIGIGINVNNSWQTAPDELSSRGTSLCDATGRSLSLQEVTLRILGAFETSLGDLATGDQRLTQAWQRRCWLAGKRVRVPLRTGPTEGRCAGIDADGALLIETTTSTERVYSGAIELAEWVCGPGA
jgi:BirA family biotin operon repressor/biotin-[acetyl-CoA-carboxylase] ligase